MFRDQLHHHHRLIIAIEIFSFHPDTGTQWGGKGWTSLNAESSLPAVAVELTGDNDVGQMHLGDPVHGGDDNVQEDGDYEDTAIPSTNAFRDFTC